MPQTISQFENSTISEANAEWQGFSGMPIADRRHFDPIRREASDPVAPAEPEVRNTAPLSQDLTLEHP